MAKNISDFNTDGMTETQIAHVESLRTSLKYSQESESQWRVKSVEDWDKAEEQAKEIEELKKGLGELKADFAWSKKLIDSKNRKIERLEKYASQFVED